jgi:hypothetical protein
VTTDNEILNELNALKSPLANFRRSTPYALPAGYFAMLAQALVQSVKCSEGKDTELGLSKAMPFSVPEGYLAALPERLSMFASTSSDVPFQVPERYFATLPDTLLHAAREADKVLQKKTAVAFRPQRRKQVWQWAAAAVVALGLGLGAYRHLSPVTPDAIASKRLEQLGNDAITTYIELHVDEFDTETLEASVAAANTDLNIAISELNEQEINQYLAEDEGILEPETIN